MNKSVLQRLALMRCMLRVQQRKVLRTSHGVALRTSHGVSIDAQQQALHQSIIQLHLLALAYQQHGIGGLLFAAVRQDVQLSVLCSFFRKHDAKVRMARLYGSVIHQAKKWWRQQEGKPIY
jgi:hypothetical protein